MAKQSNLRELLSLWVDQLMATSGYTRRGSRYLKVDPHSGNVVVVHPRSFPLPGWGSSFFVEWGVLLESVYAWRRQVEPRKVPDPYWASVGGRLLNTLTEYPNAGVNRTGREVWRLTTHEPEASQWNTMLHNVLSAYALPLWDSLTCTADLFRYARSPEFSIPDQIYTGGTPSQGPLAEVAAYIESAELSDLKDQVSQIAEMRQSDDDLPTYLVNRFLERSATQR